MHHLFIYCRKHNFDLSKIALLLQVLKDIRRKPVIQGEGAIIQTLTPTKAAQDCG